MVGVVASELLVLSGFGSAGGCFVKSMSWSRSGITGRNAHTGMRVDPHGSWGEAAAGVADVIATPSAAVTTIRHPLVVRCRAIAVFFLWPGLGDGLKVYSSWGCMGGSVFGYLI